MPEPEARRSIDIRVLKYLAPALLTTLACIQLFLGLNFGLTPWKGGGFGMFSTVDSPGARTIRVYLETDDGEIPTKLPTWRKKYRNYTRSFPTDFRVHRLAVDLAAATWVYRKTDSSSKDEKSSDQNGAAEPTAPNPESMSGAAMADAPPESIRPRPEESAGDSIAKSSDKLGVEGSDSQEPYPRVKAYRPGEGTGDQEIVPVNAVRVEVWRALFDVETNEIFVERLKQVTEKVPAS